MAEEAKQVQSTTKKPIAKYYATGKRKCAIARVWLKSGSGIVTINKKDIDQWNASEYFQNLIFKPLELTNTKGRYDVMATVKGGGPNGQVEAVMYGIAKVLNEISDDYRGVLKSAGLLTRDDRIVERKKYGKKKARKGTQYRKR